MSAELVAALAIVASFLTTRATLRHQRMTAHEDRLWRERAAIYVHLLDLTLYKGGRPETDARLPDQLIDAAARVHAFASDEVVKIFDSLRDASRPPSTNPDDEYDESDRAERLGMLISDLVSAVREELNVRVRRRSLGDWVPLSIRLRRWRQRTSR